MFLPSENRKPRNTRIYTCEDRPENPAFEDKRKNQSFRFRLKVSLDSSSFKKDTVARYKRLVIISRNTLFDHKLSYGSAITFPQNQKLAQKNCTGMFNCRHFPFLLRAKFHGPHFGGFFDHPLDTSE